jgi:hypothetical protein
MTTEQAVATLATMAATRVAAAVALATTAIAGRGAAAIAAAATMVTEQASRSRLFVAQQGQTDDREEDRDPES